MVNVGSVASDGARLDLDDLEGAQRWRAYRAYGQSKLALLMASLEWARRFDGSKVTVNVVHPGLVATGIGDLGGFATLAWRAIASFGLRPEQGAEALLHVALAPELAGQTGGYFKRLAAARPNPLAEDGSLRARLWAESKHLAG